MSDPLTLFHDTIRSWFRTRYGTPTAAQAETWPHIVGGRNLLVTAPTGTGKTIAAFLWPLNQLMTGVWPQDTTSVLYVSPLKALNNDIQRNLLSPIAELREAFQSSDEPWHEPRVMTRSGDTPLSDRRKMLRRPPEILITTPESLNLLLSSRGGRSLLPDVRLVILDEVHAIVGTKRGVQLATALERIQHLTGELQRVALSATVRPVEPVARFVAGYVAPDTPRPIEIAQPAILKHIEVALEEPQTLPDPEAAYWEVLAPRLYDRIQAQRSVVIFVNSRRLSETITAHLNRYAEEQSLPTPVAYAHHGSLAKEVRLDVEQRLKEGALRAIVATSSLEMGIDIGALDEVILIQAPHSVASAIQRIGRAGHNVGDVRRGRLVATHERDLLELTVLSRLILDGTLENVLPMEQPLDVLTQVIVSMVIEEAWHPDQAYEMLCRSYPYHRLPRASFDRIIDMLRGRFDEVRLNELKPRIAVNDDGSLIARRGTAQVLYANSGTIPDRGLFQMRHAESLDRSGELDEEFVWENGPGSRFAFGNQRWLVERVTHNDVVVRPYAGEAMIPFWRGDEPNRSFHLSDHIGRFLEQSEQALDPRALAPLLHARGLAPEAAGSLEAYLKRQREATKALPHARLVVMEVITSAAHGAGHQIYLHAAWGRPLTRPLALALTAAWRDEYGFAPEIYAGNDGLAIMLPEDRGTSSAPPPEVIVGLVRKDNLMHLLRQTLESSSFFGARFRESASCALLITRSTIGRRLPLWLSRVRAQDLMEAVAAREDFPISLEAWRSCCQDDFDLDALAEQLERLQRGDIGMQSVFTATASPFAQSEAWRQVNSVLYRDEATAGGRPSALNTDLIHEIAHRPHGVVPLPPDIAQEVDDKLQRTLPEYAPQSTGELLDWLAERALISADEWARLLELVPADEDSLAMRTAFFEGIACATDEAPSLAAAFGIPTQHGGEARRRSSGDGKEREGTKESEGSKGKSGEERQVEAAHYVGLWLRYRGPVTRDDIHQALAPLIDRTNLDHMLDSLAQDQRTIEGHLLEGDETDYVCDRRNYEFALRRLRARRSTEIETRPLEHLALDLVRHQGLLDELRGFEGLLLALESLGALPIAAELWESDILPARIRGYQPLWLDRAAYEESVTWTGAPNTHIALLLHGDIELYQQDAPLPSAMIPSDEGHYTFDALRRLTGKNSAELCDALWSEAWQGRCSNDAFAALRSGVTHGYHPPSLDRRQRGRGRATGADMLTGRWYATPPPPEQGPLEADELCKDRVRLLLGRYPVLFRALLEREAPALRWSRLFRALRLLELAGEVVSGRIYEDIDGVQFTTSENLERMQAGESTEACCWVNACDPASLCGTKLDDTLPPRRRTTHLTYIGHALAVISHRNGRELSVRIPPAHPQLASALDFISHLLHRPIKPLNRVYIETINEAPAVESPYVDVLLSDFNGQNEGGELVIYR